MNRYRNFFETPEEWRNQNKGFDVNPKQQGSGWFANTTSQFSNTIARQYDHNPARRDVYPNEKHMILPTDYGWSVANFAGPGTHLNERLERGDPPVDGPNGIDIAAKYHDMDYAKARTASDVRMADQVFMKRVAQSSSTPAAKAIVNAAMGAKQFAEDAGFLKPTHFLSQEGGSWGACEKQMRGTGHKRMFKDVNQRIPKRRRVIRPQQEMSQPKEWAETPNTGKQKKYKSLFDMAK